MLGYPFSVTETDNKHPNLTHCSEEWIYSCVLSRKQTIRGFKAGSEAGTHWSRAGLFLSFEFG